MVLLFLGDVGGSELLLIGVVALVVLGPKRLPEIARKLGSLVGQFRRASTDLQRQLNNELRDAENPSGFSNPSSFGTQAAAWASRLKAEVKSTFEAGDKTPSAASPAPSLAVEVDSVHPTPPGAVAVSAPPSPPSTESRADPPVATPAATPPDEARSE
jgi:sec-independent protein translocase protein TatB